MAKMLASMILKRAPLFTVSWSEANKEMEGDPAPPFALKNGTTREDLLAEVARLQELTGVLASREAHATTLQAQRDAKRVQLRADMEIWRKGALYVLSGTRYADNVPTLPGSNEALSEFVRRVGLASNRWKEINALEDVPNFAPPLILKNGLTQAQFAASIAELQAVALELETLEDDLPNDRARRDTSAETVYNIFKLYRAGVEATFPDDSPVVKTLPTLMPRDTGHTPEPVKLTGVYNPLTGEGDLSYEASKDADIDHYEVRIGAGPRFKMDDSTAIADLDPRVTQFSIPSGYLPRGATVWAVVSVVLTDGRSKASNAVKFAPPLLG